jgi:Transglycosylase SLT domain
MRPILALAILMVSFKAAVPDAKHPDQLSSDGENSPPSHLTFSLPTALDQTRPQFVLTLLRASADAPHRQGEDAADLAQPPPLAGSDVDADQPPPDSIDNLCNALFASALHNDLPVPFFANLIWQESRFQHDAVSRVGALGIAQFMPEVAIEVGLGDPFDPHEAIPASAKFLHTLREQFGNLGFTAAAYNAGAHRVTEWLEHKRTLPRETQVYVARVTGRSVEAWRKAPPNDSQLTFVRLLPCRGLPAFADLEQAQLREAPEAQQQSQEDETPTEKPARGMAAGHVARISRPALGARHASGDRHFAAVSRSANIDRLVRNFHGEKLEVGHRHNPHDKRRMA